MNGHFSRHDIMPDWLKRLFLSVGATLAWLWTGAVSVLDLFGRATTLHDFADQKSSTSQLVSWVLQTPWYGPALFGCILTGFAIWLNWPRSDVAAGNHSGDDEAQNVKAKDAPQNNPEYISDAVIVDGWASTPPEYRARFARSGSDAVFSIEFDFHLRDRQSLRKKIPVYAVDRFSAGQIVTFPIVSPCMTDAGMRWHFGLPPEATGGGQSEMLGGGLHYRGRVIMHASGSSDESCYFILSTIEKLGAMPSVTGEHMFGHMFEWEGKHAPNGNPRTLFK